MGLFRDSRVDELVNEMVKLKDEHERILQKFFSVERKLDTLREDFDAYEDRQPHADFKEVQETCRNLKDWVINISEYYDRINKPISDYREDQKPVLGLQELEDSET